MSSKQQPGEQQQQDQQQGDHGSTSDVDLSVLAERLAQDYARARQQTQATVLRSAMDIIGIWLQTAHLVDGVPVVVIAADAPGLEAFKRLYQKMCSALVDA